MFYWDCYKGTTRAVRRLDGLSKVGSKVRTKSVDLWSVELVRNGQSHFSSDGFALFSS